MTGKQSISISSADFIKGQSTSDRIQDGGYSPLSMTVNLLSNPGTLSSTGNAASIGGNVIGFIVASCENQDIGTTATANYRRFVDSSGYFYTYNSSTIGTETAQDTTNTYTSYYSDMVAYIGNYYASSHNAATGDNVCKWNGTTTATANWFYTTFSSLYLKLNVPHPMIVFNKSLYIADGQYLHKYDGNSGGVGAVPKILTLSDENTITSLSIDPGSGRMMVGYTSTIVTGGIPAASKIGLYDGTNPTQFIKIVPIEEEVYSMIQKGGFTYAFYGLNFGYWNGNGFTWLRNVTTTFISKQYVTHSSNFLFFLDGQNMVAYGEVSSGKPAVFNNIYQVGNAYTPTAIFQLNNNQIGAAYVGSINLILAVPMYTVGNTATQGTFISNVYDFGRPVEITDCIFITDGLVSGSEVIQYSFIDSDGITKTGATINSTTTTRVTYNNAIGGFRTLTLQVKILIASAIPVRKVIVFYNTAE